VTGFQCEDLSAIRGVNVDQKVVRFCFARKDATLNTVLDHLARL
jgi:methionine aminotransferase